MKLKKLFTVMLTLSCVVASLCMIPAVSANAASTNKAATSAASDVAHGIYDFDNSSTKGNEKKANSNDLINFVRLTLVKSGSNLIVYGDTRSNDEMSLIGFKNITLQRQENGVWRDYQTWTDLYNSNSIRYSVSKTVTVPAGYYYRAVANHYAEKTVLLIFKDTQTYYNETTSLFM